MAVPITADSRRSDGYPIGILQGPLGEKALAAWSAPDVEALLRGETQTVCDVSQPEPEFLRLLENASVIFGHELRGIARLVWGPEAGRRIKYEQINTRNKAGDVVAVRWEVSVRGSDV